MIAKTQKAKGRPMPSKRVKQQEKITAPMNKTFVLDTNVLLHDHTCIESFADNTVVLPMAVIEELDKFKRDTTELGRNARGVIRRLDLLREHGRLGEGVRMENGGTLRIITNQSLMKEPLQGILEEEIPDNRIIRVAYYLLKRGDNVFFVSKDINARLKADALGIEVMDFEKQKVNFDELFTGYREVHVKPELLDEFYANQSIEHAGLDLLPNEFVNLIADGVEHHTALARAGSNDRLIQLNPKIESVWHIKPRSREQRMALELLMDDSVHLVTLMGPAGTGKTLLALAAGLEKIVNQKRYDRLLVTRPIMPFGKDIGYLPGAKEEKLANWMLPIFDNLTYLMLKTNSGEHKNTVREKIEKLQRDEVIELEALTYIRGRSIPRQFVIVDEAQNLTPHEVKTIISRAGEGTKMVLTGDPYQIDNPYLDSSSNGLSYAVERMKTQSLHGHVTLNKSERSTLAALAASLL
jgi:PhoH-like ATPase